MRTKDDTLVILCEIVERTAHLLQFCSSAASEHST